MEKFTFENLRGQEGSKAQLHVEGEKIEMAIESVAKTKLDGEEWDAFQVVLSGDAHHLPQGIYHLTHPAFGEADLFVSPNSPTEYEIQVTRKKGGDVKAPS
jgi:hypothetical protein